MPEMSGFDVISELKKGEETFRIPVIFITGLQAGEYEDKGVGFGAADYISKPFRPSIVKLRVYNQIQIVNYLNTINRISITDQLTGILNKRGFDNEINREWGRTIREGSPISILIIDVDEFKVYNDKYGHQQGDVALRKVATAINSSLMRSTDIAARRGGGKFVVLFPSTDVTGALEVAEKIRKCIELTEIPLSSGDATWVTASIGVNSLIPMSESILVDFIEQAEKVLYTAKKAGGNGVCCRTTP